MAKGPTRSTGGKLEPGRQPTSRETVTQMAKDAHRNGNPQQRDILNRVAQGYGKGKR